MLHNNKQKKSPKDDSLIEIYICGDASSVLLPSLSEMLEMADEIGDQEFDFTSYCG